MSGNQGINHQTPDPEIYDLEALRERGREAARWAKDRDIWQTVDKAGDLS